MKFSLLINMKMPTVVGIFIFISRENFMLSWVEHEKKFYNLGARTQHFLENCMCTKWRLRSACASVLSDQSSLCIWRLFGSLATHWVPSEDSDQVVQIGRQIWVFDWCTWLWYCRKCCTLLIQTNTMNENVSLCWGFTAQLTKWSHVERAQFT